MTRGWLIRGGVGHLLVREEATCGVVAAQRSVREVTGQDNALRLHASLGFCRLVDGDEFVALGFQVVDDGGQRVHVYQPKPI